MSNAYYWHGRVKEKKFLQLIRCFADDKTAKETAEEIKLDRKSVNGIFMKIRRRVLKESHRRKFGFSIKDIKTSLSFFVAESEDDCKKYDRNYKSKILVILFDDPSFLCHIIYAETDNVFDEILKSINTLRDAKILHCGFYRLDDKPHLVKFSFGWQLDKNPKAYLTNFAFLEEQQSAWLMSYFFYRIRKFKGINSNNFILHLKETEWRANKIPTGKENLRRIQNVDEMFLLHSQHLYDDLLGPLKKNAL